eukprot:GHVU01081533.1.p4 GENE.GHVU01081533.1~~GHVU01081533.1.p4  ORF type:complete len:115 (+),score=19.99 GHVU01081533.1:58-402(+)
MDGWTDGSKRHRLVTDCRPVLAANICRCAARRPCDMIFAEWTSSSFPQMQRRRQQHCHRSEVIHSLPHHRSPSIAITIVIVIVIVIVVVVVAFFIIVVSPPSQSIIARASQAYR